MSGPHQVSRLSSRLQPKRPRIAHITAPTSITAAHRPVAVDLVDLILILLPDTAQRVLEPPREVLDLRGAVAQRHLVLPRAVVWRGIRAPVRRASHAHATATGTGTHQPRRRGLPHGVLLLLLVVALADPAVLPHGIPRVRTACDVRDRLTPDTRRLRAGERRERAAAAPGHGADVMRVARPRPRALAGVPCGAPPPEVDGRCGDTC